MKKTTILGQWYRYEYGSYNRTWDPNALYIGTVNFITNGSETRLNHYMAQNLLVNKSKKIGNNILLSCNGEDSLRLLMLYSPESGIFASEFFKESSDGYNLKENYLIEELQTKLIGRKTKIIKSKPGGCFIYETPELLSNIKPINYLGYLKANAKIKNLKPDDFTPKNGLKFLEYCIKMRKEVVMSSL